MKFGIKNAASIIEEVISAVEKWNNVAGKNGVGEEMIKRIGSTHRLDV